MRLFSLILISLCAFAHWAWAQPHFERRPNTTLRLPQNPQSAQSNYQLVDALGLTFERPVGFAVEPGATNRLFVVERFGRIIVITNLAQPTRTVFMDITNKVYADYNMAFVEGLSSIAFHPGYATNGYFFATYTLRTNIGGIWRNMNRLSRFTGFSENQGSPKSELPLITQLDDGPGHNMNDVHFGPDGYLYCAIGDEGDGGSGDDFDNAQRIDKDYFSAILRIDVDRRPGNLPPNPHPSATTNYCVPADNPFVGATTFNGLPVDPARVRTEFYAVGFRNCWRMSFDPLTGRLYEGDVGQHGREEINVVLKGGNYGWSYREGSLVGSKGPAPFPENFVGPIVEYGIGHATNQGFSVIGGVVYRGARFPELYGAYVFSDFVSGNVWMLRPDGTNAVPMTRIAGGSGLAGFGADPRNGDILMADHERGHVYRLARFSSTQGNLPLTLADTGAFANLETLQPNDGVVPYDLNVPFWSDNARKTRWFSVPDVQDKIDFSAEGHWTFPAGTVWVKHFDLEMTNGVPESARRIETRLLVRQTNGVYGLTYRWGESTSNATLVAEGGFDEPFLIRDGTTTRTQIWHYPSRNECLVCHTPQGGFALGFNTAQLNRDSDYSLVTNQILAMNAAGYFSSLVTNVHGFTALAHATNQSISREFRVRSYLAANCAQCHQPGSGIQSFWDARINTRTRDARIINGALFHGAPDDSLRVVKPGAPSQSMIWQRIASLGPNHMPPLATSLLDQEAIDLLHDWIAVDLADYQTFSDWQLQYFGATNSPLSEAMSDPDGDGAQNELEYLLKRNPTNGADGWRLQIQGMSNRSEIIFPRVANRGFEIQRAFSLDGVIKWETLPVPGNPAGFSSSDGTNVFIDRETNQFQRFYRARISEP